EVNRQVTPVELRKAHGVFLSGQDDLGRALFAPVDNVEDLLLRKPVMIGEALGVNQFRAKVEEALFKALWLSDPAERGDSLVGQELQPLPFSREYVLKVKRMVNTFDDAGIWVVMLDSPTKGVGAAVALGNEDRARP